MDEEQNKEKEIKETQDNGSEVKAKEQSENKEVEGSSQEDNKEEEAKEDAQVPEEKQKEEHSSKMSDEGKEGSFKPIFIVMAFSIVIVFLWDKVPFIKNSVHAALDPTAGWLLGLDLTWGMVGLVFIITVITTLIQKYATDQETLRELKKEQKTVQEQAKQYQGHPEKLAELNKKQMEFFKRTFKLNSRSMMFTGIPFILLFRWFNDYFSQSSLEGFKFFGIFGWVLFYLIGAMVFSSVLRKLLKVV